MTGAERVQRHDADEGAVRDTDGNGANAGRACGAGRSGRGPGALRRGGAGPGGAGPGGAGPGGAGEDRAGQGRAEGEGEDDERGDPPGDTVGGSVRSGPGVGGVHGGSGRSGLKGRGSGRSGPGGGGGGPGGAGGGDAGWTPRIPLPRSSVEDAALPSPPVVGPVPLVLEHGMLMSLLGAWALAACSPEEAEAVEAHLGECGRCADEARRLREAVGLLHPAESLDLDPGLRTRVLESCLGRRAPRIPVPQWAAPYDTETARLDALLRDMGDAEWHAPVRLRWFDGREPASRRTTVAGVIAHLLTVDGLVAAALGLDDPLDDLLDDPLDDTAGEDGTPQGRTEAYWRASPVPPTRAVRAPWRKQTHALVRTASFAEERAGAGEFVVSYGGFGLPLRDAMLDRAFECWVHAEDIAEAVDYPYPLPSPRHLNGMIGLAARMLPAVLAERRRAGLAPPGRTRHLVPAGEPGRSLRLEIEGAGGGEWLIALDSPGAVASAEREVAHVVLDVMEFCRLAAGHVPPQEAAAGQAGDRKAVADVLFATASLSRM